MSLRVLIEGENRMGKLKSIFCRGYAIFFTMLVLSLIFVDKKIKYFSPLKSTVPNIILALIGIVVLLLLPLSRKKIKIFVNKFTTRECGFLLAISSMILYFVQIYIFFNTYYHAGWDCDMVSEISERGARGEIIISENVFYNAYLSQNPHQAFMVFILTIIKKISNHFGIQDTYYFSVLVGLLCVNIVCVLITLTVKNIKGRYYAFWAFVLAIVFLALSPQGTVPYTDIYAMPFVVIVFYLYTCNGKLIKLKWILMPIVAFIGCHIKVTVLICLIAVGIVEMLKCTKKELLICILKSTVIIVVSYILSNAISYYGNQYIGFVPDKNAEFTPTHYAMMGLNEDRTGVWNGDDVNYSASFATISERQKGNFKVIWERIQEKGVFGLLVFEYKKLLMNYNDGTFYYGKEGGAVLWESEEPNCTASRLLRYYYFRRNNLMMNNVLQVQWLMVLMLVCIAAWSFLKNMSDVDFILAVTIVGITLFTLIFEGRSRYLIVYTPYYIMLAVSGFKKLEGKVYDIYYNVYLQWREVHK